MTSTLTFRVFDTGPLSAFANADVLGVLRILCDGFVPVLLDEVAEELRDGVHRYPRLQHVLDSDWLHRRSLKSDAELERFAEIGQQLIGANGRNVGETAVIAWVQANHGSVAVIDDGPARKAARKRQLEVIGSLRLLIDAVGAHHLSVAFASRIADELISESRARFPFKIGGFTDWAPVNGHM